MSNPEVSFSDREIDEAARFRLGGLVTKLKVISNDTAKNRYGKRYLPNPSDIQLTPIVTGDGVLFVMRMWHQTDGANPAVIQAHDTTFTAGFLGEEVLIRTEDGNTYPLTAREAVLIYELADRAIMQAMVGRRHE